VTFRKQVRPGSRRSRKKRKTLVANNLKNSVAGKDIFIQNFQKFLYTKLKALWPVDDTNLVGYGRAYRNSNNRGYVPEVFVDSAGVNNTQYNPVFFDKSVMKALFFFNVLDLDIYKEGSETTKVELIFITDISKLKPGIQHRADEEVMSDVRKYASIGLYQFNLTGEERGFGNVFRQFSGLINKDGEVFEDRHPLLCFKFNFELFYLVTETICN
jgi:hypothetical protein